MVWVTALGTFLRAGFGFLLTMDKQKREMRLEQIKMIAAAERGRTTKRGAVGWALVTMTMGLLAIDLYVTQGENLDAMIQLVALALAAG